jgi:hypothetical protein
MGFPAVAGIRTRRMTTMSMKITEIRVTAGKDVYIFEPAALTVIVAGKRKDVPGKLAAQLFKAVAGPAEKLCGELKDFK